MPAVAGGYDAGLRGTAGPPTVAFGAPRMAATPLLPDGRQSPTRWQRLREAGLGPRLGFALGRQPTAPASARRQPDTDTARAGPRGRAAAGEVAAPRRPAPRPGDRQRAGDTSSSAIAVRNGASRPRRAAPSSAAGARSIVAAPSPRRSPTTGRRSRSRKPSSDSCSSHGQRLTGGSPSAARQRLRALHRQSLQILRLDG